MKRKFTGLLILALLLTLAMLPAALADNVPEEGYYNTQYAAIVKAISRDTNEPDNYGKVGFVADGKLTLTLDLASLDINAETWSSMQGYGAIIQLSTQDDLSKLIAQTSFADCTYNGSETTIEMAVDIDQYNSLDGTTYTLVVSDSNTHSVASCSDYYLAPNAWAELAKLINKDSYNLKYDAGWELIIDSFETDGIERYEKNEMYTLYDTDGNNIVNGLIDGDKLVFYLQSDFDDSKSYYVQVNGGAWLGNNSSYGECTVTSQAFSVSKLPYVKVLLDEKELDGSVSSNGTLSIETDVEDADYCICWVFFDDDGEPQQVVRADTMTAAQAVYVAEQCGDLLGTGSHVRFAAVLSTSTGLSTASYWEGDSDNNTSESALASSGVFKIRKEYNIEADGTDLMNVTLDPSVGTVYLAEGDDLKVTAEFSGWLPSSVTVNGEDAEVSSTTQTFTLMESATDSDDQTVKTLSACYGGSNERETAYSYTVRVGDVVEVIFDYNEYENYTYDEGIDIVEKTMAGETFTLPGYQDMTRYNKHAVAWKAQRMGWGYDVPGNWTVYYYTDEEQTDYEDVGLGGSISIPETCTKVIVTASGASAETNAVSFSAGSYKGTAASGETVTWNANTAAYISMPTPESLGFKAPDVEGVEFLGWKNTADEWSSNVSAGKSAIVYSDTTYTYVAQWSKPVTVTLVKKDGSTKVIDTANSWSEDKLYEGDEIITSLLREEMAEPILTSTTRLAASGDYTTLTEVQYGWYLDRDGDRQYDAGEEFYLNNRGDYSITINESITLRAYMVAPMKVTYIVNDVNYAYWHYPDSAVELFEDVSILNVELSERVESWTDGNGKTYAPGKVVFHEDTTLTANLAETVLLNVTVGQERAYVTTSTGYDSTNLKLNGNGYTHYLWQYSADESTWVDIGDVKDADTENWENVLNVYHSKSQTNVSAIDNAWQMPDDQYTLKFRALVWNYSGEAAPTADDAHVVTNCKSVSQLFGSAQDFYTYAYLKFNGQEIWNLEAAQTAFYGQSFSLSAEAYFRYDQAIGYQWYRSLDGGSTWTALEEGAQTVNDTIAKTSGASEALYYCQATYSWYVTSDYENQTFALDFITVELADSIEIHTQPKSQSIEVGETATLSVSADSATAYQWQMKTVDASGVSVQSADDDWTDIAGAISSSYSYTATEVGTVQLRCKLYNVATEQEVASDAATITVNPETTYQLKLYVSLTEVYRMDSDNFTVALTLKDADSQPITELEYAIVNGSAADETTVYSTMESETGSYSIPYGVAADEGEKTLIVNGLKKGTTFTVQAETESTDLNCGGSYSAGSISSSDVSRILGISVKTSAFVNIYIKTHDGYTQLKSQRAGAQIKIELPEEREGFTFLGWTLHGGEGDVTYTEAFTYTVDASDAITEAYDSQVVYIEAVWEANGSEGSDELIEDEAIRSEDGGTKEIDVTGQLLDNPEVDEADIYSIEINWGSMEFEYAETVDELYTWDAASHTYTMSVTDRSYEWKLCSDAKLNLNEAIEGIIGKADQSYVVVFNHSNQGVNLTLSNRVEKSEVTSELAQVSGGVAATSAEALELKYVLGRGVENTIYDATSGTAAKVNVSGGEETKIDGISEDTASRTTIAKLSISLSRIAADEAQD